MWCERWVVLRSDFLNIYVPYQFPPIRLLDFATGVAIFNVGHTQAWQRLQECLTPRTSTIAEVIALLLFVVLYRVGKDVIHTHCYRAYCASAPAIVVLFTTFIMTNSRQGLISKAISIKPLAALSGVNAEIYLMQYCVYFFIKYLCKPLGLTEDACRYRSCQNENSPQYFRSKQQKSTNDIQNDKLKAKPKKKHYFPLLRIGKLWVLSQSKNTLSSHQKTCR